MEVRKGMSNLENFNNIYADSAKSAYTDNRPNNFLPKSNKDTSHLSIPNIIPKVILRAPIKKGYLRMKKLGSMFIS